jgi:hypothetical protein
MTVFNLRQQTAISNFLNAAKGQKVLDFIRKAKLFLKGDWRSEQ